MYVEITLSLQSHSNHSCGGGLVNQWPLWTALVIHAFFKRKIFHLLYRSTPGQLRIFIIQIWQCRYLPLQFFCTSYRRYIQCWSRNTSSGFWLFKTAPCKLSCFTQTQKFPKYDFLFFNLSPFHPLCFTSHNPFLFPHHYTRKLSNYQTVFIMDGELINFSKIHLL